MKIFTAIADRAARAPDSPAAPRQTAERRNKAPWPCGASQPSRIRLSGRPGQTVSTDRGEEMAAGREIVGHRMMIAESAPRLARRPARKVSRAGGCYRAA